MVEVFTKIPNLTLENNQNYRQNFSPEHLAFFSWGFSAMPECIKSTAVLSYLDEWTMVSTIDCLAWSHALKAWRCPGRRRTNRQKSRKTNVISLISLDASSLASAQNRNGLVINTGFSFLLLFSQETLNTIDNREKRKKDTWTALFVRDKKNVIWSH